MLVVVFFIQSFFDFLTKRLTVVSYTIWKNLLSGAQIKKVHLQPFLLSFGVMILANLAKLV